MFFRVVCPSSCSLVLKFLGQPTSLVNWLPESAFRVLPHECLSTDRHNDGPSLVILSAVELVVVMVSPGWAGSIRLLLICYEQVASHSVCLRSLGTSNKHRVHVHAGTSFSCTAMECLEGDWVDGALASRPCSTSGLPYSLAVLHRRAPQSGALG